MALDAQSDVKPTLRRECWEEWIRYYTFGQTRDRMDYARRRQRQLGLASDFDEADWAPPANTGASVPEPTDVLAPPPAMMIQDAGAPISPVEDASADAGRAVSCGQACESALRQCVDACTTGSCEKSCSARFKACSRKCRETGR